MEIVKRMKVLSVGQYADKSHSVKLDPGADMEPIEIVLDQKEAIELGKHLYATVHVVIKLS